MAVTLVERFIANVRIGPGCCWEWTGGRNHKGYGGPIRAPDGTRRGAHVMAFFLAHGRWPEHQALHLCDNPPCVRPSHLVDGTQSENIRQAFARGRMVSPYAGRTHCKRGHEFTIENTYLFRRSRICRTRQAQRDRQRRKDGLKGRKMTRCS